MPEIPNRTDEEEALAALLASVFRRYGDEANQAMADKRDLPAAYWSSLRADIATTLAATLGRIHRESAERMAQSVGADMAGQQSQSEVWAAQRASLLADELTGRIQDSIGQVQQDATATSLATLGVLTAAIWSAERAKTIAMTEITEANSAGELAEAEAIETQYGVSLKIIWQTQVYGSAPPCQVCQDLHDTEEEHWGAKYPSGPPVHPRCQCGLRFETA